MEKRLIGIDTGSPNWFRIQKEIILSRPLIRHNYNLWYSMLLADEKSVPENQHGKLLEIGAGGGFLKDLRPEIITSDVVPGIADIVSDARSLPFPDNSLRAIFLVNTFHHIPDVEKFLRQANQKLVPHGVISLIEPASTPFGGIFWKYFHPEPYNSKTEHWSFESNHHMQSSNQALSGIVFKRDKQKLKELIPDLQVEAIDYLPWISYMAAGGVTRKNLVPGFFVPIFKAMDFLATPFQFLGSLNWHIRVRKN